jgi:Transposase
MNDAKYIGLDVHQATISAAVLDSTGKMVMESVLETKAATILQFVHGLRGSLWVTFEEGTWAAWLYDLLKARVTKIVVCDPRRNALLKEGSKSDRIDARKLAERLRAGLLRPVYHGEKGLRTLRELSRSYRKRPVEAVSTECQWVKMMAFVDPTIVSTKVSRGHFSTSDG